MNRIYFLFPFFLILLMSSIVIAFPMPSHIIYGAAYAAGEKLTQQDTGVLITLEVGGTEIARYTMGTEEADSYMLVIPMDSECEDMEDMACEGDEADIYINGEPINENPVVVGSFGELTELDINVDVDEEALGEIEDEGGSGGGTETQQDASETSEIVSEPDIEESESVIISIDPGEAVPEKAGSDASEAEADDVAESEPEESPTSEPAKKIERQESPPEDGANPFFGVLISLIIIGLGLIIFYISRRKNF